jgi:hypothetical protein
MNRLAYRPSSRRGFHGRSDRLSRRSLGEGGSFGIHHRLPDSYRLSQADYAAISRIEKQRALCLASHRRAHRRNLPLPRPKLMDDDTETTPDLENEIEDDQEPDGRWCFSTEAGCWLYE